MRDRRLRQDAVAEIEDERAVRRASRITSSTSRSSAAPPASSASGSTLPCTGTRVWNRVAREGAVDRPVEADRIDAGLARHSARNAAPAPRGKPMILAPGMPSRTPATIRLVGCDAPALELVAAATRRPRYRRSAPRRRRPRAGRRDNRSRPRTRQSIRRCEALRIAIGKQPRRRLIGRPLAGDHVGRHRPRRAAKSDQRRLARRAAGLHPPHGLIDRRQHLSIGCSRAAPQRSASLRSARAAVLRPRRNQTLRPSASGTTRISENKIAASKPNRRIGCSVTSAASSGLKHRSRKPPGFLPHRTIFRQIASRLPHHPDRRHRFALALEHAQQRLYPHASVFERLLP